MGAQKNLDAWGRLSTAEKLKFLAVVNFDFEHCERAMDLAHRRAKSPTVKDPMTDERYITYSEAAVIRYCRPFFSTNIGSEKVWLPDFYVQCLTGEELNGHKSVTDLPRQVSAHSDSARKEVFPERVREKHLVGWATVVGYPFFAPKELESIFKIMKKIRVGVRSDMDTWANQLYPNAPIGAKHVLS